MKKRKSEESKNERENLSICDGRISFAEAEMLTEVAQRDFYNKFSGF